MIGLAWPKTHDVGEKTLEALDAHLATESDKRRGGEIGAAIERLWRLEGGDTVNLLIDRGESFSTKNESERGMKFLDAAVDLAPDHAEAGAIAPISTTGRRTIRPRWAICGAQTVEDDADFVLGRIVLGGDAADLADEALGRCLSRVGFRSHAPLLRW